MKSFCFLSEIEYSITIKTGDQKGSMSKGPVYINILGRDEKQTNDLLIPGNEKVFSIGSIRKFQLTAPDVGKPQRIVVRHDDRNSSWFLDYVEISVHNFLVRWKFSFLRRMKN